jgi:glycosyltransferase involved in cell wall biosynthesis
MFEDYFVIIVDDKSTDKSYEIAKAYEQQHPDKIVAI